jgi:putative transposase
MREKGLSSSEAALTLRLPRSTLYRWRRRFREQGPLGLQEGGRRPKRVRVRSWFLELVLAVRALRRQFPAWGKDTPSPLLQGQGYQVSVSTVGRILPYLRRRGKRRQGRPWVLSPRPGVTFRQFTARDVVSRWDVAQPCSRATAQAGRTFLLELLCRCPFPIRPIQVDGGSELGAQFEEECRRLGIRLLLTPPRFPRRQGHVDRAQGSWRYQFYETYHLPWTLKVLRPLVQA